MQRLDVRSRRQIEVIDITKDIEKIITASKPPKPVFENKCKKCAYYEYCFI